MGRQVFVRLAVGDFVRSVANDLGIGKVAGLDRGGVHVTWFDSPAQPVAYEENVALEDLRAVELGNQHRVFHRDAAIGDWKVGRVDDAGRIPGHQLGVDGDLYFIAFPNGDKRRVRIAELHTRWSRPLNDPTAILASRTTETPFWHEGRARLMRSVMAQRAASGGLTGLFSASVDLKAHQVRVVRNVLNDPISRYLLADEVGLGKTIEALSVLRQLVVEQPDDHATLVVAPRHLHEQWREEVEDRFGLGRLLGDSVRIVSLDDLSTESAPRLLIVDEAHHPADLANSSDAAVRERYVNLARLAHAAPRLLLLSATPVLRNEDGFLAMLHLLDPAAYPLSDREAFRRRVAQRQQIADWLADLQDDASSLFVEEALDGISAELCDDSRLRELVEAARPYVDADEADADRQEALTAVRAHLGEVYRLHRRLLRTRRGSLEDPLWGRAGAQVVRCVDPVRAEAERLLLHWRNEVALAVHRGETNRMPALELWRHFLQAVLSHPVVLKELVSARIHGRSPKPALVQYPTAVLHIPFLFEGEKGVLEELLEVLADYQATRDETLAGCVLERPDERFVVFVDRPGVAELVHAGLEAHLGAQVRRHEKHEDVVAFTRDRSIRVLICDVSAEEGLNLHESPAQIVHYDLPLSPNRIEQRMGRLDRIGAKKPVSSIVFDDEAPMSSAWLALLQKTIGVFDDSIASLQYVLEEHLQAFVECSFEEGFEAFGQLADALRHESTGLQAELGRIRRQESLDALEADPSESTCFEEMEDFDLNDDQLQADLESWLVDRLHFECEKRDPRGWRRRYAFRREGRHPTLVSVEHWLRWFRGMIQGARDASSLLLATPEVTFGRRQAHMHRLPLVRIGHPLFDGAVGHAFEDDRGVAYAMWRWRSQRRGMPSVLAFRFDFLVEADATPVGSWEAEAASGEFSSHAVRRRLDALLPPRFVTVWLDEELEELSDPKTLTLLSEQYRDKSAYDGRDWNLTGERWEHADAKHPVANWEAMVKKVSVVARQLVLDDSSLGEASLRAQRQLTVASARTAAQLIARIERLSGPPRTSEEAHLHHERELAALMNRALGYPVARLDSIGAVFLSGEPLVGGADV
jgi:ATP-dependent helicase HepA